MPSSSLLFTVTLLIIWTPLFFTHIRHFLIHHESWFNGCLLTLGSHIPARDHAFSRGTPHTRQTPQHLLWPFDAFRTSRGVVQAEVLWPSCSNGAAIWHCAWHLLMPPYLVKAEQPHMWCSFSNEQVTRLSEVQLVKGCWNALRITVTTYQCLEQNHPFTD